MSYSCSISFKQLKGDEVFSFFQRFKELTLNHFDDIAEENFTFSPLFKNYRVVSGETPVTDNDRKLIEQWAKLSIFNYRWFYDKELQLLGVYSVSKCQQKLFDTTVYFQNSCDQDYEFEEWKGIKWFEECAEKWKVASLEEVNRAHTETYQSSIDEEDDLEYYRRWSCYNEIWKRFEYTLFNDSQIVYLQLFAYWDIMDCIRFTNIVVQKVQQWVEDIRKKENLKTVNNKQLDLEDLCMEQQEQM